MKRKIEEKGIKVVMYKRYVDDINLIVEVKNEMEEKELWKEIRSTGDNIHEADFPANYPDKKVPILDIKVWVETNGKVLHEYYCKPVSSKSVIDAQSAMPFKDRRTVLTQDL